MKTFNTIKDIRQYLNSNKSSTVGFVPTMGALHHGHIELIRRAKAENEIAICSIFVNPTQFNNPEDLKKYPRTIEEDSKMLHEAGCDVLFAPEVSEMYPSPSLLRFDFGYLEHIMEGKFRPGHFNGVGTVVAKLFNIVNPTKAYFGQKDIQQVAVIKTLVKDLSFGLDLVVCETVRETDGLAMSSRNRRLSAAGRASAPTVFKSLLLVAESLTNGKSIEECKNEVLAFYKLHPEFTLEYYEICKAENLESLAEYDPSQKTALIIAVFLEGVRLIDNYVF